VLRIGCVGLIGVLMTIDCENSIKLGSQQLPVDCFGPVLIEFSSWPKANLAHWALGLFGVERCNIFARSVNGGLEV
jgi:hypothetical protein